MKQPPKIDIKATDEAKVIIKNFLDGMPITEIMELMEYSVIEFWLGEQKAFLWLDMLENTDPCELEKYLKEV